MHIKFATLRDKHALEAWIYELEPLHGSKQVCMEKGLNGLGESQGWLGESHEDGRELDELDEQLGESDEDCHKLDELKNNSASRMSFLLDMYECVSVELQGGNSTGGLKVWTRIEGTRRVTPMTRRVGMCFKELGE